MQYKSKQGIESINPSTLNYSGNYFFVSPSMIEGDSFNLLIMKRAKLETGKPNTYLLHIDKSTKQRVYVSSLFSNQDGSFRFDTGKGCDRVSYTLRTNQDGSIRIERVSF